MLKSTYNKNILKVFTGNIIGTIITFATLPILTRLYTQEDFGNFQLLISIIALLASVSSLKYELAIVLPKSKEESNKIVSISILILISYILFLTFLLTFFGDVFYKIFNIENLENLPFLLLSGIAVTGIYHISTNIVVRENKFGLLANNGAIKPLISNSGGILIGFLKPSFAGLYLSQIASLVVVTIMNFKKTKFNIFDLPLRGIKETFLKYKKLALVNTPLEFLNNYSIQLPVLLIGAYFGASALGLFMIADRLLNTPLRVIGQSFQKVYYKEAADAYNLDKLTLLKVYKGTVKKLALIGLLPLILVITLAPWLTEFALGNEWREAGVYMQLLMIGYYFRFINSPVSNTLIILEKQEVGLVIVIISVLVRWGTMVLFSQTIYTMLLALMISTAVFYIFYNFIIYYFIKKV